MDKRLPHQQFQAPRSMQMYNEKILSVTLKKRQMKKDKDCCADTKSRLEKKNLTIPRLELIATHMAANLLSNAEIALCKYPIPNCYGWSDNTTVLFWL